MNLFEALGWEFWLPVIGLVVTWFVWVIARIKYVNHTRESSNKIEARRTFYIQQESFFAVLIAILVSMVLGNTPFVQNYIQGQVKAGVEDALDDSAITLERALRHAATTVSPNDQHEFFGFLEENILNALTTPVRTGTTLDYALLPSEQAGYFALESNVRWNYELSRHARKRTHEVKQSVMTVFLAPDDGLDSSAIGERASLKINGVHQDLEWVVPEGRPSGELFLHQATAGQSVTISRGTLVEVELEQSFVIPIYDTIVHTFRSPTKGFELEFDHTDVDIDNHQLYVVNPSALSKSSYSEQRGQCGSARKCTWKYDDWLMPGCGLALTWHPKQK